MQIASLHCIPTGADASSVPYLQAKSIAELVRAKFAASTRPVPVLLLDRIELLPIAVPDDGDEQSGLPRAGEEQGARRAPQALDVD